MTAVVPVNTVTPLSSIEFKLELVIWYCTGSPNSGVLDGSVQAMLICADEKTLAGYQTFHRRCIIYKY
jgi:hypothetical protein